MVRASNTTRTSVRSARRLAQVGFLLREGLDRSGRLPDGVVEHAVDARADLDPDGVDEGAFPALLRDRDGRRGEERCRKTHQRRLHMRP